MRRHAKAATAGSTQRRAKSLGGVTLVVIGALALVALAIVPSGAAAAAPEAFWTRCASNSEGDASCSIPRGIASSPLDGDVYVGDSYNARVVQFSPWGVFLRTWGWDVVQSGPGDNGSGFEICVPANGDVCKAGTEGSGAGQFGSPQGIAVDSVGDVYVLDRGLPSNNRVQKFDSEGHFLRMFGGEVNSGTSGNPNICTNAGAPTDVCQAGGTGSANGQFGELSVVGNYIAIDTGGTATASDDKVYVGDQERIQSFNAAGEYQSQIAQPGVTVKGLAVDPAGDLYVSFCGAECGFSAAAKANVRKLSPAGTELGTVTVANPQALATDSAGDLYVVDGNENPTIREFTSAGVEVPGFAFKDVPNRSTGIATGSACLSAGHDLYVSNSEVVPNGFIRAYGPAPDEAHVGLCPPPPHAPEIVAQVTLSVEATTATLQASINPKFWADTSYYAQYATAACIQAEGWAASCVTQVPASPAQLGAGVIANPTKTAKLSLAGLTPGTEYLYRFAAESSGGGPVFGKGGTEAQDGKASLFTTPAPLGPPSGNCPNAAFRTGPSAALPDCRAYEMVSPVDKNGGDITSGGREGYTQTSSDGDRITYTTNPAFGDQPSSRNLNQYLATRGQGGWSTHGINPPLAKQPLGITPINREAEAFSPDLCSEWLYDYNSVPLVPQAQEGFANLYRQDLCGGGGFEAVTVNPPAPGAIFNYVESNSIQGFSADGNLVFFAAKAKLTADAAETNEGNQAYVYDRQSGETHLVSMGRSGAADVGGTYEGDMLGGGTSFFSSFSGNLQGAIASDGSRAYWTSGVVFGYTAGNSGRLFLRENPAQPQSALEHGGATGKGDLSRTSALALTTAGSAELIFFFASGEFSVGDPIEGPGIAPGTTIAAINELGPGEGEMTLSAPATEETLTEIISASKTITNLSTETGAFAPGQTLIGPGIAPETTVTAVNPGEGKLTLSKPVSLAAKGVKLEAFSECTEADKACTVPVSNPEDLNPRTSFWGANPSGSEALYSEGLLENETTDQATGTLYRFDAETRTSTLVAEHFRGVLGTSKDLSRVYFISTDVLTGSEKNAEGDEAQAEEPNLYLEEGGELSFVGTLLGGGESGDLRPASGSNPRSAYAIGSFKPLFNTARVSPDGAHIAFQSRASLTGYDNTDAQSGEVDVEVFTYEAGGALDCVSCRPSGERPSGRRLTIPFGNSSKAFAWGAAWIPGFESPLHGSNVLSEDGSRLFFNANDSLVPGDTNGTQDVYEWETPGTGSCTTQSPAFHKANGGCLYLISSGESPDESSFREASPDGRDVFFTTAASLLPQDPGHIDLYNARVEGGFPQPPLPAACEGESCQSAPPPPTEPTLSSASFRGEGNPKGASKPRCAKGKRKVRRAGKVRCVRRKAQHAKHKHKRTAHNNRRTAR